MRRSSQKDKLMGYLYTPTLVRAGEPEHQGHQGVPATVISRAVKSGDIIRVARGATPGKQKVVVFIRGD